MELLSHQRHGPCSYRIGWHRRLQICTTHYLRAVPVGKNVFFQYTAAPSQLKESIWCSLEDNSQAEKQGP